MRRIRVSYFVVLLLITALLGYFLLTNINKQTELNKEKLTQINLEVKEIKKQNLELKTAINKTDNDEYIEYIARTKYGYMTPDERRFVITNPKELYGEGQLPSDLTEVTKWKLL